jgi:ferric-dicitrate binding protein FerR (iron transport regulator)
MEEDRIQRYLRIARAIARDIAEYGSYDTAAAFRKTQRKIRASQRKRTLGIYLRRVAAVMLLPLLASTVTLAYLYLKQRPAEEAASYRTLHSAPGVVTQAILPDRSDVWLNAGSTLRYPERFGGKEREVYLEGEAYFRVESDAAHPFCVNLNRGMSVKAFGTRFGICSYPEDSVTEVALEEGVVDVVLRRRTLHLHPDEMLTFDAAERKFALSRVNTAEKTAWKDGRLLFRNAPLEEVVRKLSRRYNVDIELQGNTASRTHRFRATFTTETVSQALDYLKMAAPMEWSFVNARQREDFSYTRQKIIITLK